MSELRSQCDDGRLEVVIRVVPLAGAQADALRQRQLAAIVTLLRRAATRSPDVGRTQATPPGADADRRDRRSKRRTASETLDEVSP